jgi:hypothetical protein
MPLKRNEIKRIESRASRLAKLERKGYTCSDAGSELRIARTSDAGLFLAEECKYGKTSKKLKSMLERMRPVKSKKVESKKVESKKVKSKKVKSSGKQRKRR